MLIYVTPKHTYHVNDSFVFQGSMSSQCYMTLMTIGVFVDMHEFMEKSPNKLNIQAYEIS